MYTPRALWTVTAFVCLVTLAIGGAASGFQSLGWPWYGWAAASLALVVALVVLLFWSLGE